MKETTKSLFNRFLENGGTKEEFLAGRRAALAEAEARIRKYTKEAAANRRERIEHLVERGYSRFEAEEKLRLEEYEAHDAMGGNPIKRIKRSRIPKVGLRINFKH